MVADLGGVLAVAPVLLVLDAAELDEPRGDQELARSAHRRKHLQAVVHADRIGVVRVVDNGERSRAHHQLQPVLDLIQ